MLKLALGLLVLFTFSTCATKEAVLFEEKEEKSDAIQVFKIKDRKIEDILSGKKTQSKKKKRVREKKRTFSATQKKSPVSVVEEKKPLTESSLKVEEEKSLYPVDYPEAYKGYDKKSATFWKDFNPIIIENEKHVFELSFMGLQAGHIQIRAQKKQLEGGSFAYHMKGRLQSSKYYSYIYELDDTVESYLNIDNFIPIKYILKQKESNQDVNDLQVFDQERLKTFVWYRRMKKGKLKQYEKEKFIPRYFQDSFSALFFVRGLPLIIGDTFEFPVVTRGKIWILKGRADKFEEIKVLGKWVNAIKVKAETHFPGVLKKKGDISFWYSADSNHRLLKFEAKVKIGSIQGELVEYNSGR